MNWNLVGFWSAPGHLFCWVQAKRILRECGRGGQKNWQKQEKEKCGHYPGERNFGERAKVIKEDFKEALQQNVS